MDALTLKLGQENQYIFDCVLCQLRSVYEKAGGAHGNIVGCTQYPTYLMWNYANEVPCHSFDEQNGLVFEHLENTRTRIIDDLLACVAKVLRALRVPLRVPQPSAEMFQAHLDNGKSLTALNELALQREWPQHVMARILLNVVPFWKDPEVMSLTWKTVVAPVGQYPGIDCAMWLKGDSNRQYFLSHWGAYYVLIERAYDAYFKTAVLFLIICFMLSCDLLSCLLLSVMGLCFGVVRPSS